MRSQLRINVFVFAKQGLGLIKVVPVFDCAGFRIARSVRRSSVPISGSVNPVSVEASGGRSVVVVQAVFGAETVDSFRQLSLEN
jgi:hypothetical protein